MQTNISERDQQLVNEFIAKLKSWRHSKNQVRGYMLDLNGFVEYLGASGRSVEAAGAGDLSAFLASIKDSDPVGVDRKASAIRQFYSFLVNEMNVLTSDPAYEMQVPDLGDAGGSVRGPGFNDLFSRGDMVKFTYAEGGDPRTFEGILNGFKRHEGIRKAEFMELDNGIPQGEVLIDLYTVVEVESAGPPKKAMSMDGRELFVLQYNTLDSSVKVDNKPKEKQSFVDLDDIMPTAIPTGSGKNGIRSVAASWSGHYEMMAGVVEFTEGQQNGDINISLPDGHGNCKGQYFMKTRNSGTWTAIGPDGAAASGQFKILRNGGSGSGRDTDGNEIRFSLGDIRYDG
jgi:hypothetical protein